MLKNTNSNRGLANFIAYPVMFLYLFNITPLVVPVPSVFYITLSVFFAVFVFQDIRNYVRRVFIECYMTVVLFVALGVYGTLLSVMWGPDETYSVQIFIKSILIMFTAAGLVAILSGGGSGKSVVDYNSEPVVRWVFELFFRVCVFQSIIVLIEFVFPNFRDAISGVLVGRGNIEEDHPFRFHGLHDSGGFSLTAIMGVAATYGVFTCVSKFNGIVFIRLISTFLIVMAIAFVGRTGFFVFALGVGLLSIRWGKSMLSYLVGMAAIASVIVGLFSVFFPDRFEYFGDFVFGYAFEFLVNYSEHGNLSTTSSDDLASMLFIPDIVNVFFGSGSFDEPNAGVDRSDSGYMKTMLSLGLVGIFVVYGLFLSLSVRVLRAIKFDHDLRYFGLVFFMLMFFVEIKAPVFYQNDLSRLFWLVFVSAVVPWFVRSK
ncbi:MAG: hypothetical protein AB3X37_09500 [Leptothrix ochracea]